MGIVVKRSGRLNCDFMAPGRQSMQIGVAGVFSDDIAIDLGTANTLVHVIGRGVIINEPSVVAFRNQSGLRQLLAVGEKAQSMPAGAPEDSEIGKPLRDGVIADFIATEEMLRRFIKRSKTMMGFRRPRILICVPAGATPVERRAVYEPAVSAGARRVYLIEEPVAASLGAGLPVQDATGSMVVDIGGGTTDIAVLSKGSVVQARSLRVAGNAMDEAIIRYIRRKHHLLIGEANGERIKIEAGTAIVQPNGRYTEIHIRGRDLRQGRAKSIVLGRQDVSAALQEPIEQMAEFIQRALEDLPQSISSAICERGIHLTGGGALLEQLDQALERRVGVPFAIPDNPTHCVVMGTASIMQDMTNCAHLLIKP